MLASFAAVTASSAILPVPIVLAAICELVIVLSAILAAVTALSAILAVPSKPALNVPLEFVVKTPLFVRLLGNVSV